MKKKLSLLLALSMALGMVTLPVHAEETEAAAPIKAQPDFGPHAATIDRAHAYDPFERMREEEAIKSLPYVENTVVFKRNEGGIALFGISETDELLASLGAKTEVVRTDVNDERIRLFSSDMQVTYKAEIDGDVWEAVEQLREMDDIVYAEPDYLFYSSAEGLPDETTDKGMGQQWYINPSDPGIKQAWKYLEDKGYEFGGIKDTIVAVIDTGVDYTHEDLANNMWVNVAELNGRPGVDDDGNGYKDDIHGVTTVSSTYSHNGDPMDDHGHGTHVAGIIGMNSHNGSGGVGVAPGARIMAIKAGQASGYFASTDIAEAIDYASAMGADVINMSFGSYAASSIIEDSLINAFGTSVLVAAAGNDGIPNLPAPPEMMPQNMYPAAYPYVLGVMAHDRKNTMAGFSNWDYLGNDAQEYEIIAPGVDIYSTLPGNRYALWDGTSMAAPMVSGAAALLRAKFSDKSVYSSRFIMGQLASATSKSITYVDRNEKPHSYAQLNISESLDKVPTPNVSYKEHYIFDTADIAQGNDADGIIDAGETVDLAVVLRNQWGQADNVTVTVDTKSHAGIDNPYVTFITDTVEYGAIGTFNEDDNGLIRNDGGLITGVQNPIRFIVSADAPNDTIIPLHIVFTATNGYDSKDKTKYEWDTTVNVMVQRGRVLKGVVEEDMTLTKDDYWIIENSTLIPKGVTVNVEPGTQIQFWSSEEEGPYADKAIAYIKVEGEFNVNGTYEEPVEMFPSLAFAGYAVEVFSCGPFGTPYGNVYPLAYFSPVGNVTMDYVNVISPRFNIETGSHINAIQEYDTAYGRYIYEGKIKEVGDLGGAILNCKNLNKSAVKGFRPENEIFSQYGGYVNGNLNTVQFDNSAVVNIPYTSENSVFLENIATISNNQIRTSTIIAETDYVRTEKDIFSDAVEYNGKRYVKMDSIFSWASGAESYKIYDVAKKIANERGGYIASLNNAEEHDFLYNKFGKAYVGYIKGEDGIYRWDSGEEVEYIPTFYGSVYDLIYMYSNYLLAGGTGNYSIILEFPNTVSEEDITAPIESIWNYLDRSEYSFYNNAILNRTIIPDTSTWMRVTAPSGKDYQYTASHNYWGTTDTTLINEQIVDFDDYMTLADIEETPILTEAPEEAYPFVVDVEVFDTEGNKLTQAGAEEITVKVTFNRDMDQTIAPTVSFGPAEPWTDFLIHGDWADARTWVGTYKVTPMSGDGMMYFRVTGAAAADDPWLVTGDDWGRFAVEIITSGAEAMTLQAWGEENKVQLQWVQDDYDVLAGYNLYRSTTENGTYTKINDTLIPAEDKSYTDTNVEPGKDYYYKFTVMTTDLKESGFSNIAHAAPIDNVVPVIKHTPVTMATLNAPITLNATITDNIRVDLAVLNYRVKGSGLWKSIKMNTLANNVYMATIPASDVTADIEYYIEVSDGVSWAKEGSDTLPYLITVDDAPLLYSISPSETTIASGTRINLTGANFVEGVKVYVGDLEATNLELIDSNNITAIAPENSVGIYDVKVVNPDGQSAVRSRAFTYKNGGLTLQVQSVSGEAGQQIRVPIVAENAGSLTSAQFTLNYPTEYLTFMEVEKSISAADCALAYNDNAGALEIGLASAEAINGNIPLVYAIFRINEDADFTEVPLTITNADINDMNVETIVDGVVNYLKNYSLSGRVRYFKNSFAVEGVTVSTEKQKTTATDANGSYTLGGYIPGSYTLYAEKSDGQAGISAYDASLILQHSVKLITLDSDQLIAGDVNDSGEVNAADAAIVLQVAVGKISGALPGSNKVWKFTPEVIDVTVSASNLTNKNFTAIMLGDVSGDWSSAQTAAMLTAEDTYVTVPANNGTVTIPVSYEWENGGKSIDMVLKFSENVTNAEITVADGLKNFMVDQNFENSELRIAIAGTEDIPFGSDKLFDLTITTANPITETAVEEIEVASFKIDEAPAASGQKIIVSSVSEAMLIYGGEPVDVLPAAGEEITVSLASEEIYGLLVTAFYDADGRLVSVLMTDYKTPEGAYEIATAVPADTSSLKVMLLKNDTMEPLKDVKKFTY